MGPDPTFGNSIHSEQRDQLGGMGGFFQVIL